MDVDRKTASAIAFGALVENTDMPIAFVTHDLENLQAIYGIAAEIKGGLDKVVDRPFLFPLLEVASPFIFTREALQSCSGSLSTVCRSSSIRQSQWAAPPP